jgi:hypothetical protein
MKIRESNVIRNQRKCLEIYVHLHFVRIGQLIWIGRVSRMDSEIQSVSSIITNNPKGS